MRTTLDIDDEVLMAAKELARRQRKSAGRVISDLVRQAMTRPGPASGEHAAREPEAFYGFRPFASRGGLITNEEVDRLRNQDGV